MSIEQPSKTHILAIDDDNFILKYLIRKLPKDTYQDTLLLSVAKSGQEGLEMLDNTTQVDLVLLDVEMPGINGLQVLQKIRSRPEFQSLPVIIMSANIEAELEAQAFRQGATDFIHKPFAEDVIRLRIERHLQLARLQADLQGEVTKQTSRAEMQAELAEQQRALAEQQRAVAEQQRALAEREKIEAEQQRARADEQAQLAEKRRDEAEKQRARADEQASTNAKLLDQTVSALAAAIDAKDKYTNGHSHRVAFYSRKLAEFRGFSKEQQKEVYTIALLHDIGKIGIPEHVINKPSRLTDEEYEIIKRHTLIGASILSNISSPEHLTDGAKYHHERYDGKGYPEGLSGEKIPLVARIIGLADAYDTMTSKRSYRDCLPQDVVREQIVQGRGTQFDPDLSDLMLKLIDLDTHYRMRQDPKATPIFDPVTARPGPMSALKEIETSDTTPAVTPDVAGEAPSTGGSAYAADGGNAESDANAENADNAEDAEYDEYEDEEDEEEEEEYVVRATPRRGHYGR